GYIQPSQFLFASSVFFVKKKNRGLRMVVNYWKLNKITVQNKYVTDFGCMSVFLAFALCWV
ncbi:hypothetical protein WOLCODRAFT_68831, partial [Wolfiporia cocos MD-104 SS10]